MAGDQQPQTVVIIKKGGLGCGGLILALFALGIVASVVVKATRGTPTATPTQAVVTPATPGPGAQAAAVAVAPTYRRSYVRFGKNSTVLSCTDYTFESDAAAMGDEFIDQFLKGFVDPKAGDTAINKSCAQQFPSNGVLASCETNYDVHTVDDAGTNFGEYDIQFAASYYDLDSLTRNDAVMKKCMATKGDWTGVDKKSSAYFDAVRARGRREVEQLRKTLGQAGE